MTPKQLEIASLQVLKMLRKKPMPYKWTHLQNKTDYTPDQTRQIIFYLRRQQYIKEISFVDFVITEKGKQAKGYYAQRIDKWYGHLPRFWRYMLSPASAAVVSGFFLFFFLSNLDVGQSQNTWRYSNQADIQIYVDSVIEMPAVTSSKPAKYPWFSIRVFSKQEQPGDKK